MIRLDLTLVCLSQSLQGYEYPAVSDYRYQQLDESLLLIQGVIQGVLGSQEDTAKSRIRIMEELLSEDSTEAALILTIFLAANIESVSCELTNSYKPAGQTDEAGFSKHLTAILQDRHDQEGSMSSIRHLNINTKRRTDIAFPPSLESLVVRDCQRLQIHAPHRTLQQLRRLELHDTACTLEPIHNILSNGYAPILTHLLLRGMLYEETLDYRVFVDCLVENCPMLETFELVNLDCGRWGEP